MKHTCFKIVLALIFTFTCCQLNAQEVKYDSTYRPGAYVKKIEEFKKEGITKKDFVFLGNSITAGTNWAKLLDLPNAKNRGISGDITFGVLERLDQVISGKPAKVFVLIGINDISRNIPDSLILRNYKNIISRIKTGSKKTKIYFYTLLPVNASFNKFKNHYGKDEHILWLNSEIRKLADKKVTVIDLYTHFIDGENHLKANLTHDGLHLKPEGYQVWAEVLKNGGYLK
ncbi:GDSL-type esterase/lipase family protein [Pedobacter heparinus]|uniref:Lipolytic protein G-D-S-L family n=1 Tax=Pedobacter heparinus (strain ATCC 13125 / DSM 2366 / CIP 104194 / JCM 7457 / NBRC 12017 / NCIMB 9290 / NRRL B-14731 / HIM 762-3) TaxID=485917 RepID=C6Y0N9_PEDHD|nr:GDSL-type esterase/lipase family protein [Pedobacter heparinus]ACU02800.1 lipolytic protein G-D-S-L family [Pedobacter heparinus DSM 2366]